MSIFFDKVDAAPVQVLDEHSYYINWLSVLVNTINQALESIEEDFNLLTAQSYTDTEISDLLSDGLIDDGVLLYDSTNDLYVGMQAGALVQFTTAPYP